MADPRPIDTLTITDPSAFPLYDNQNVVVPDLEQQVAGIAVAIANLENAIRQEKRPLLTIGIAAAQTNADGNATFPIYQAPAGMNFFTSRVVLEAGTFDATPYTPAAPYSNANFWFGLFVSANPNSVAQGQLLDFTPTTAAAQGIPNIAEYPNAYDGDGPCVQGTHYLVGFMKAGPASKRLTVRYQGYNIAQLGT